MLSKDTALPPGRSIPHEFVEEEGLDGSAQPEIPWYQEPPSNCILYARMKNCLELYPAGKTFCKEFLRDGTTVAERSSNAITN